MSSDIRRIVLNTRERFTSTDFNDATALHHRALLESLGAEYNEKAGVLRGFEVAVVPASMEVSVTAGLALRAGTAPTTFDSNMEWIELRETDTIDLTAHVDPTNPRWVAIEVVEADAAELTTPRDRWNPTTGAFESVSMDKIRGSAPSLVVTAGTPAVAPALPDGVSGRIPLAYVYIPAAAAALTAGDTIDCRPLLHRTAGTSVDGGGVSVATTSTRNISVHPLEVKGEDYPGGSMRVEAIANFDIDVASNPFYRIGQIYPVGVTRVYLYAAAAPYPPGYAASLAPRLFRPGSNIGTGNRIPSVPTVVADAVRDCIVVASTTTPTNIDNPVGDNVSGEELNDAFWAEGPLGPSVYLGSVVVQNSGDLLGIQQYKGAGLVTFGVADSADLPNSQDTRTSAASGTLTYDARRNGPLTSAGSNVFPDHITEARCNMTILYDATTEWDATIRGASDAGVRLRGGPNAFSGVDHEHHVWISPTGIWSHEETGGDSSILEVLLDGYRDGILSRR